MIPAPRPSPASPDGGFAEAREAVIDAVATARPMLGAMLEGARSIVLDGDVLAVGFDASEDGVRKMVAEPETTRTIETLVGRALGRAVSLRVSVPSREDGRAHTSEAPGVDTARGPAASAAPPSAAPPSAAPGRARAGGDGAQALASRARKDPAVRKALDEFGAQIVDVRSHSAPVALPDADAPAEDNP